MEFKIHSNRRPRILTRPLRALLAFILVTGLSDPSALAAKSVGTKTRFLERGIESIEFDTPLAEGLTLIALDPSRVHLRLLTASELKLEENLNAKQWSEQRNLLGAINAGMYQTDYKTSVGLLKTPFHTNNSRLNSYRSVLAFDPLKSGLPQVQIIDRQCQPFDQLKSQYGSLLQGIRMLNCEQKNSWAPSTDRWPIAAIGVDKQGKVLLIFSKKPQTPHDFIKGLLTLPLDLKSLMYLEGGPPAQFYFKVGKHEIDLTGGYTTSAAQDPIPLRLPIPNVIGVVAKPG